MSSAMIIDCHGVGWQSGYALAHMEYNQQLTGVIYGFLRTINTVGSYITPDYILFAWDSKKSRRKRIFSGYKAKDNISIGKAESIFKQDVGRQLSLLRTEILPDIGFHNHFLDTGYEADDIMASLVNEHPFDECIVVSADGDMLQIISDTVSIYNPKSSDIINIQLFRDIYGIEPAEWAEVKSLAGCTSDKVPGIAGVGEKTALKYIRGELTKGKAFDKIIQGKASQEYQRDKTLVTLPMRQMKHALQQDTIHIRDFISVCKEYGLLSFLRKGSIYSWKKVLNII